MNESLIHITTIPNKEKDIDAFFYQVLSVCIAYKYPNQQVLINGVSLTRCVFDLTDHDEFEFLGKKQNGQRMKEVFVAAVYMKKFLSMKDSYKYIALGIPENEESYDVTIALFNEKPKEYTKGVAVLGKDHVAFPLQIKEHFDFSKKRNQWDVEFLSKKTHGRSDELFLFYNRDPIFFNESPKLESFLEKNKNIDLLTAGHVLDRKGVNGCSFVLRTGGVVFEMVFTSPQG